MQHTSTAKQRLVQGIVDIDISIVDKWAVRQARARLKHWPDLYIKVRFPWLFLEWGREIWFDWRVVRGRMSWLKRISDANDGGFWLAIILFSKSWSDCCTSCSTFGQFNLCSTSEMWSYFLRPEIILAEKFRIFCKHLREVLVALPYTWMQYLMCDSTNESTIRGSSCMGRTRLTLASPIKIPTQRLTIVLIWWSHESVSSIYTPRFLTNFELWIIAPIKLRTGGSFIRWSCRVSPQTINSVLAPFTFIPCWRNHVATVSRQRSKNTLMCPLPFSKNGFLSHNLVAPKTESLPIATHLWAHSSF